jgi:hypothetical protein
MFLLTACSNWAIKGGGLLSKLRCRRPEMVTVDFSEHKVPSLGTHVTAYLRILAGNRLPNATKKKFQIRRQMF